MDKYLTNDQKQIVLNKLNTLIPSNKSCICNNPQVMVLNEFVAIPFVSDKNGLSGNGVMSLATKCDNCGRMEFFSADMFGLKLN